MSKPFRMSHSAAQCWKDCQEKHYLQYIRRIRPKEKGSSLAFGIAIDTAICNLLEAKQQGKDVFTVLKHYKKVFLTDKKKGWNNAFDNPTIRYRSADHDSDTIEHGGDGDLLTKWSQELKCLPGEAISAEKQKNYKKMTSKQLKMFNRMCWLSLKHKGILMLEAFERDILPKIDKVIAVQHKIEGNVGENITTIGYIDLICTLKGYDKPVVLDVKTASLPYDDDSVFLAEQLALYLSAVGSSLSTDLVGFVVLLKNMGKDSVCSKCGYAKEKGSRFKTCNHERNNVRCGGDWKTTPVGKTQLIVDKVSKDRQNRFMDSFSDLALLASQGKRVQNWNNCKKYGMCDFYHLCHHGDESKYDFPEEEK